MSRRTLTLLLASLLALVLTGGAAIAKVPYVALGPGPMYNTLGEVDGTPVLAVKGRPTFPTEGHLDLTTVGVQPTLTLAQALQGWFARDLAVVPRDVVYPPGKSDAEVKQDNAAAMVTSQSTATTAAARQLGFPVAEVTVKEVPAGSPSEGLLRVGDVVRSVDGRVVRDAAELRDLVSAGEVGQVLRVGVVRGGAPTTVEVTTGVSGGDGERRPVIGVVTAEKPLDAPFTVDISLEDVGGPSAGLMFALGILDKLGAASLTGGKYVAGTGEIRADGGVGPIGGIHQKLLAAKRHGAVVFLVPADNCAEAVRRPPSDLPLARVASIDDALTALDAVRRGAAPELCPTS